MTRPAIGYARVSTDKQENSADAQERRIRAQAEIDGLDIAEIITDIDEFSGDLNRPGIKRVLEMVRAGSVSAVVITKLDRLTRSTRDVIELMELFRKKNVAFVSIAEKLDTDSPMGRFFVRMIASIAELEREMIGSRTRDGLRNLKEQGYPAGPAPYGWRAVERTAEERAGKVRRKMVPDEREREVINLVNTSRAKGWRWTEIRDALNSIGYRTRSGAEWQIAGVRAIWVGAQRTAATTGAK